MKPRKLPVNSGARHSLIGLILMGVLVLPFLVLGQAQAVSKTWDGGCGADTTWSCANNWSDDIVPASGDTVTFNATSTNNSVVDASFAGTITTININSGYTGTISLSRSLTVSTLFAQEAGTFTAGGQTLNIATFFLTGGSFTASSGTTSVSGSLGVSGSPTFNSNGGTVNFTGNGGTTLTCNNITFSLVTFTNTAGTKTVGSDCNLPLGNNPTTSTGSIALDGTLSGSGTLTMGNPGVQVGQLHLESGNLYGFSGLEAHLSIDSGSHDFSSYTNLKVHDFTLNSGGSIIMPSGTASFLGNFTINGGSTFDANGGTVNFNINGAAVLACNNVIFNLVTIPFAGDLTVGSDCNLPLGNNPVIGSGSIDLNGTLSGTGTLAVTSRLFLRNGSSLSGFSGLSVGNYLDVADNYDFGNYTTFDVGTGFELVAGHFTAPAETASFAGDFTIDSGSIFDANGGSVNFSGNSDATIICDNTVFNLVTFTHTAGTKTVSSDCSLPLGNNPTVGNGAGDSGTENNMNGTAATGYGSGGGGAGWYGGMGGNGLYGGGGGGAAGFTAANRIGGSGGSGIVVLSPTGGSDTVLTSGNSWTVPAGVTSVKVWAIGGGGGGAGATNIDASSGGGGGAGGVVYQTFTVIPGDVITYSLGNGGYSGVDAANGGAGGNTTVTVGVTTITANGGAGGEYNTGNAAAGGSFSGGDGGADGGSGSGASGDTGGGGGGGIGGADGIDNGGDGGTGGQGNDVSGLFAVLSGLGYPTTGPGVGGTNADGGGGAAIVLDGTLSGGGILTTAADLTLDSGGSLSGFSGLAVNGTLDVSGVYNFGSYSSFTANGNFTLDSGAVATMPNSGASVNGTFDLNSGATFTASSGTTSFASTFINSGGTFNANGGTVALNGTNQVIVGNTTFYNLAKTVSSPSTLIFAAGSTQTVLGKLTLRGGGSGSLLRLASSSGGSPWHIDVEGTTNVAYVNVSDSDATPGKTIVACSSVDSGGNSGWSFNPSSCTTPPPAPPTPAATTSSSSGSSATANIFNFALFQAALTSQNAQNQPPRFPDNGDLPSKIYDFVRQFPHGKELMKAAGQFLWALLIILIMVILIWLYRVWRHFRKQKKEADEGGGPTVMTPPAWPPIDNSATGTPLAGTTIHPTAISQEPTPLLATHKPLSGGQNSLGTAR